MGTLLSCCDAVEGYLEQLPQHKEAICTKEAATLEDTELKWMKPLFIASDKLLIPPVTEEGCELCPHHQPWKCIKNGSFNSQNEQGRMIEETQSSCSVHMDTYCFKPTFQKFVNQSLKI